MIMLILIEKICTFRLLSIHKSPKALRGFLGIIGITRSL